MKPLFSNFPVAGRAKFRNLIPVGIGKIAGFQLALTLLLISAQRLPAPIFELPEKLPQASGASMNPDGSRTTYDIDNAHHKAIATVSERDGKLRQKIKYDLDAAGRFTSRAFFDANGRFRSKTVYKYDKAGRVTEQTQFGKDEVVLTKIAYSYDQQTGKQTGYSVFDGNGRLVNQTGAAGPSRSPAKPAFGEGPPGR